MIIFIHLNPNSLLKNVPQKTWRRKDHQSGYQEGKVIIPLICLTIANAHIFVQRYDVLCLPLSFTRVWEVIRAVYRRTDKTKGQTMTYKTQQRKRNIEQHEGLNSGGLGWLAVTVQLVGSKMNRTSLTSQRRSQHGMKRSRHVI